MKGILIDSKNKTVTDVEYDGKNSLKEWYRLLGCSMVEIAVELPNDGRKGNTIMVDEEGLLSVDSNTPFFFFEGAHQPFAGNGLVVGDDYYNGETIDVSITANDIRDKIKFYSLAEVQRMV